MNAKISIVNCDSYNTELVCARVQEAIDLAGGILSFIRPQSRVLIKPNLLMPIEPSAGVNTHPEIARAVIKILKSIECQVFLGDGPCAMKDIPEKIDEVYEITGMKRVCREEGAELVSFDQKRWRADKFPLAAFLDKCDHVVNLPKFKTHNLMVLTGAVKNLFGLVWSRHKIEMHKKYFEPEEFAGMLADIYQEVKPSLTIVDAVVAMEGDGPATSGKLRRPNIILAGKDCVAMDSVLAVIMGLEPTDIPSTKEAFARGLGQAEMKAIDIAGVPLRIVIGSPFILPSTSLLKKVVPKPILDLARKMIKFHPCVDRKRCIRCAACLKGCPNKAISMGKKGITFDYSKCISCFCCQEFCPAAAIKVRKNWFMKLAGL